MTAAGREQQVVAPAQPRSYYGQPILKQPVWTWEIPWYFFVGGIAGASAGLGLAADVRGDEVLARRSWLISLAAGTVSPALLISDLGRPERFLNMMRLLKVTSPMSVGSWTLAGLGGSVAAATLTEFTGRLPRLGLAGKATTGLAGPALATYTAALLANTAIPVWHEARRELPFVFAGSAATSAAAAALLVTPPAHAAAARRLAVIGAAGATGALRAMRRRLGGLGDVYEHGAPKRLRRLAQACTVAGGALVVAGSALRSRPLATRPAASASTPLERAGAIMLLTGAAAERWSIFKAGFASAADPQQTVAPQKARLAGS